MVSSSLLPPPPFHSVLLNKPDQLLKASEPFQLLSEAGTAPPRFKGRDLAALGHLCFANVSKSGGGTSAWGHHEPP